MSDVYLLAISLVVVCVFWVVGVHNRLVRLRSKIQDAQLKLDFHLEQRYTLIGQWAEAARVYLTDVVALLESTIAANGQASAAASALKAAPSSVQAVRALELAESVLASALGVVQAQLASDTLRVPYIVVDQSLRSCDADLAAVDSAIAFSKDAYNRAATDYNAAIVQFPASMLAAASGHRLAALWGNYLFQTP